MNWWKRNSNTIFTIVEFVGFVGTVVSTARATTKITKKLEYHNAKQNKKLAKVELAPGVYTEEFREKTAKEKAVDWTRALFPEIVTPLIFGTITVTAMCCKQHQYVSQQTAIASSYTMAKRLYDENREKAKEIMDKINPFDTENETMCDNIEESMNGDPENRNDIFFLEYSGRRFKSNLADVQEALDLFDEQFKKSGCACFNDLYVYLGIAETKLGADNGFADMGRMNNPILPESEWQSIEWDIRKVTKATGINAEDSVKLEENGKYIYMISFNNYLVDVAFYQDMCNWELANGLHESL